MVDLNRFDQGLSLTIKENTLFMIMIIIIIKYAAYQQAHRILEDMYFFLMFDRSAVVSTFFDRHLPPLAINIFFCFSSFSNHRGAAFLFFFYIFFLLLLLIPSSVLQRHHEKGNFFSEYDQYNWLFYVGYYLKVSSYILYVQELIH